MSIHAWRNALVYGFVAWTLIAGLCIAGVLVDKALAASNSNAVSLGSSAGNPSRVGSAPVHAGGGRACETVCLRKALVWQKHDRARLKRELAAKTHPDVVTAIELAARVSGVSFARLWTISGCESNHNPFSTLGQFEGLFQLGRYHRSLPDIRGLDPFNPYVNAMHAALFIARNGEGQWSCRSDGSVHADG